MGEKSAEFCVSSKGSLGTKKEFKVQIGEFEWVGERHTIEHVTEFILELQSTARWVGFIAEDVTILGLQMVKGDGSDPKDIDEEATLGEVLQYIGKRYLVAVLELSNTTRAPTPAISQKNNTGHALRIGITAIRNGDHQVVAIENTAARDANDAEVLITNKWGVAILMNVAKLSRFFNIGRDKLAKELGISNGLFKKTITKLGIKRWPSRTMLSLENAIQGLEFGIDKGGLGADVSELRRSLNLLRTAKDQLQHGSVEVIHRMTKTELVPRHVREFLHGVRERFEESVQAIPCDGNVVMEVFAVEGSISETVGRKVRGGEANAVGTHEDAGGTADNTASSSGKSGRGRKKSRVVKQIPVSVSSGRSAKRVKKESRVVAMHHKGDSGSEDCEESSDYQPSSDGPSSSDSEH